MDGSTVSQETLAKVRQRAQRLWQALNAASQALSSWEKASKNAYIYFNSKMLGESEFKFFRYYEGNWKIMQWASKAYVSWAHNYLKSGNTDIDKTPCINKQKCKVLDNPLLL
jgi:hypothetical protein